MLYAVLDIVFVVFHTSIILFNCFGWIWRVTRKWNLVLLLLTGLSWSVLGIWYGFGYCPFTDWHWDVLEQLGRHPQMSSYIEYLIERLTWIEISGPTANTLTLVVFLLLLLVSGFLNWRDWKRKQRN